MLSEDDRDLLIYFEAVGPKELRKSVAELQAISDKDIPESDLLRHRKQNADGEYAVPPLTFEQMVPNFLRIEGGGFDHLPLDRAS